MPDRTEVELTFLDAERGLDLGELGISLPELLNGPIVDVRAQKIGAFRERGRVVEGGVAAGGKAQTRRAAVRLKRDRKVGGGALILLQNTADLPVHFRRIEPFL
jgi:hypothetical protein